MRDLSDLNDLYSAEDIIIFLEIMEKRFPTMHEKLMYKPRKYNSASKLSGVFNMNSQQYF